MNSSLGLHPLAGPADFRFTSPNHVSQLLKINLSCVDNMTCCSGETWLLYHPSQLSLNASSQPHCMPLAHAVSFLCHIDIPATTTGYCPNHFVAQTAINSNLCVHRVLSKRLELMGWGKYEQHGKPWQNRNKMKTNSN